VIDLRSEERVKHATVRNLQTSQSVLSDHRGEFLVAVSNGDTIVISAVGYFNDTVMVSPSTKMISVQLQPATKSLEEVVISGTLREIRKSKVY
jgi:hypothetical protein